MEMKVLLVSSNFLLSRFHRSGCEFVDKNFLCVPSVSGSEVVFVRRAIQKHILFPIENCKPTFLLVKPIHSNDTKSENVDDLNVLQLPEKEKRCPTICQRAKYLHKSHLYRYLAFNTR